MNNFPTFSDDLKCELKWLEENNSLKENKISGIKQQKFLLFYNLFLEVNYKKGNFEGLCAWDNGPVYTQVHAAVKHHYTIGEIIKSINKPIIIDEVLAKISKFIVEVLSDEEVSEITHKFDFWKTIINEENKDITNESISNQDKQKILDIMNSYDIDFILSHRVYRAKNCVFFIENDMYDYVVKNLSNKLDEICNSKPIKIVIENKEIKEKINMNKIFV